jgi:hypothetical protein
MEERKARKE